MKIFSRILAAIAGGFGFTSALIIALPLLLPVSRVQGVLWSTLAGFALWTGAVIWAFAARSATRAWVGLALAAAISVALVVLSGGDAP
jgi:hypothetical protein